MRSGIPLRADFDGDALREVARASKNAAQARRLLALGEIYDGASRGQAAKVGGVTLQIVRHWVLRELKAMGFAKLSARPRHPRTNWRWRI